MVKPNEMNCDIVNQLNRLVSDAEYGSILETVEEGPEISIETLNDSEYREVDGQLQRLKLRFEENIRTHMFTSSNKVCNF